MTRAGQLLRIRWAVRGTLALGVVASTAANMLHALDNPVSQTIAAWPPIALLITIELISRVPVHRGALAAVRLVAAATLAGIAAWVSYWHMVAVVARYGEAGAAPFLIPVSVDGLVVVASVCLVELGGRIRVAELVDEPSPAVENQEDLRAPGGEDLAPDTSTAAPAPAGQSPARGRGSAAAAVARARELYPDMSLAELAAAAGVSLRHTRRVLATMDG